MSDITEFTFVDPEEVHLVGQSANGFPAPLLAKAIEVLDDEVVKEFVDGLCGVSGCSVCHGRLGALKDFPGSVEKAKLKSKARHALSDSDFAFIASDGERKLPINDKAHVRNALARFNQTEGMTAEDKTKARAKILARAKEMGIDVSDASKETVTFEANVSQTDKVDEGPGPKGEPENDDHGEPRSVDFPHNGDSDGGGDTAPDKAVPEGEAESQTRDNVEGIEKAESDGRGDAAPNGDAEVRHARSEAETQTDEVEKNANTPGSPTWEHKDVALGEKAEALVNELAEVVRTFTEREKAEGGASKSTRRTLSRVRYLLEHPTLLKETSTMDATELLKALDERDAARRAEKKAEKAEKAEKAAKVERKAAKAADKAAKAADGSKETVKVRLAKAEALLEKVASEPAVRPFLNGLGVTAALRGPGSEGVLKTFDERVSAAEDRVAKSANDYEKRRAQEELQMALKQRAQAKFVARGNARERGEIPHSSRFGPNTTELFSSGLITLPDDPSLKAL